MIVFVTLLVMTYLNRSDEPDTEILHDTTILTRYEKELTRDTVIKWYEKIKYIRNKPEKVYYQNTDSNEVNSFRDKDIIFKVDKEKDELIIKTLNEKDMKIKEYRFEGTGRDFILVSQKDNLYLKSKLFYFNGIDVNINYNVFNEKKYYVSVSSGINWRERIFLKGFCGYEFRNGILNAGVNLGIKIIR